jgi:GT2 family glycosyltransferase
MIKHEQVAILLVTMDNRTYLEMCLRSLLVNTVGITYHVYVINNGKPHSCDWIEHSDITVLERGPDTSWVGGLMVGWQASRAPYVLFLNDDTLVLPSYDRWLARMAAWMIEPAVAAVGPASNVVSGPQNVMQVHTPLVYQARYLISFCCLVRRSALDAAGGLDPALTDADDIDYSIRLRQAGYLLLGDRGVYVHHHGFVTGTRLHGGRKDKGGYNSREWGARTISLLTAKHGNGAVWDAYSGEPVIPHPRQSPWA